MMLEIRLVQGGIGIDIAVKILMRKIPQDLGNE